MQQHRQSPLPDADGEARPIAELMFSDFFGVAWDMVANQIAKSRYMADGQVTFPLVIRSGNGGTLRNTGTPSCSACHPSRC